MKDAHQTPSAADSDSKFATQDNFINTINLYESADKIYVRRVKVFINALGASPAYPFYSLF